MRLTAQVQPNKASSRHMSRPTRDFECVFGVYAFLMFLVTDTQEDFRHPTARKATSGLFFLLAETSSRHTCALARALNVFSSPGPQTYVFWREKKRRFRD